ncbi:MAG: hypothetical protein DWQ02_23075 [Bacteroidetes bacterium]|nr:MAG: hypothetical protein DWQ02_23075 [Bacteroidota bacterium]
MKTKLLTLVAVITLFEGCRDVFVPDISKEMINLVAPADHFQTDENQVSFFWNPLTDVDEYSLQIVTPSFDSIVQVVLDTVITDTQFSWFLDDGTYEWNVVGLNEAYQTDCCETRTITVVDNLSNDLSNQNVQLLTPAEGSFMNNESILFSWQELTGADKYILQIGDENFTSISLQKEVIESFFSTSIDNDGIYFWRLRAENNSTNTFTAWAQRSFTLDRLPPVAPQLDYPMDLDTLVTLNQTDDLIWTSAEDVISDSLCIYYDSNQDSLLLGVFLQAMEYDLDGNGIFLTPGDYFWKVISFDQAGNASVPSDLFSFIIE